MCQKPRLTSPWPNWHTRPSKSMHPDDFPLLSWEGIRAIILVRCCQNLVVWLRAERFPRNLIMHEKSKHRKKLICPSPPAPLFVVFIWKTKRVKAFSRNFVSVEAAAAFGRKNIFLVCGVLLLSKRLLFDGFARHFRVKSPNRFEDKIWMKITSRNSFVLLSNQRQRLAPIN